MRRTESFGPACKRSSAAAAASRPARSPAIRSFSAPSTEAYYSTLLHEEIHGSGANHRLNRQFGERFGDKAYAFEELVAELGSAFLCAHLDVTNTPRADHAQYIAHWLSVLKDDKKAIFTAASLATRAVDFLTGLQPNPDPAPDNDPADDHQAERPGRPSDRARADAPEGPQ